MQTLKTTIFTALAAIILLAFTAIASANPFPPVIVYGDSLSDNGNLFAATIPFYWWYSAFATVLHGPLFQRAGRGGTTCLDC